MVQEKGKGCRGASSGRPPRIARALPSRSPRLCQKPAFLEGRGWGESVNEKLGAERAGEGPLPGTLGQAGAAPAGRAASRRALSPSP